MDGHMSCVEAERLRVEQQAAVLHDALGREEEGAQAHGTYPPPLTFHLETGKAELPPVFGRQGYSLRGSSEGRSRVFRVLGVLGF